MRYSELPSYLREKIRGYYAEVWTRHEEVRGCAAKEPGLVCACNGSHVA